MVQLLVQAGADVDAADNRKITPLMSAFRKVGDQMHLVLQCYMFQSRVSFGLKCKCLFWENQMYHRRTAVLVTRLLGRRLSV